MPAAGRTHIAMIDADVVIAVVALIDMILAVYFSALIAFFHTFRTNFSITLCAHYYRILRNLASAAFTLVEAVFT